jgi:hypothetical protein
MSTHSDREADKIRAPMTGSGGKRMLRCFVFPLLALTGMRQFLTPPASRCQRHAAGHEAAGRVLGLAGAAKQLAFQRIETVGGGEKSIAVRVAHHDSRRLRSNFDDVSVRHLPALLCQMRANNRAGA